LRLAARKSAPARRDGYPRVAVNTIWLRPRLDYRYDVIQDRTPQLLGVRDDLASAMALARWAAERAKPARILVFGRDGARIEETHEVPADGGAPTAAH
jgi:hypothetical protein